MWSTHLAIAAVTIEALDLLDIKYPKVDDNKLKDLDTTKKTLLGPKKK